MLPHSAEAFTTKGETVISKEQALSVDYFHYGNCTRRVGPRGGVTERVEEWRRNGATQTWVRSPERFRVPIKFWLRGYSEITDYNANEFHAASDCPLRQVEPLNGGKAQ